MKLKDKLGQGFSIVVKMPTSHIRLPVFCTQLQLLMPVKRWPRSCVTAPYMGDTVSRI